MSRLLLLSCSQRKRSDDRLLPAVERYDGPAFRLVRRYLRSQDQPSSHVDIRILSAQFGLLCHDTPIPEYDHRMTLQRAQELRERVSTELTDVVRARSYRELCICAGRDYLRVIEGVCFPIGPDLSIQVIEGGQGAKLAGLYNWLYAEQSTYASPAPPIVPMDLSVPPSNIIKNKPHIGGVYINLTHSEAIEVAREALSKGLGEPHRYHSWYVLLDGQRVAPKWLVSALTGLPVSAFATSAARRVLNYLGIEVYRA